MSRVRSWRNNFRALQLNLKSERFILIKKRLKHKIKRVIIYSKEFSFHQLDMYKGKELLMKLVFTLSGGVRDLFLSVALPQFLS